MPCQVSLFHKNKNNLEALPNCCYRDYYEFMIMTLLTYHDEIQYLSIVRYPKDVIIKGLVVEVDITTAPLASC